MGLTLFRHSVVLPGNAIFAGLFCVADRGGQMLIGRKALWLPGFIPQTGCWPDKLGQGYRVGKAASRRS